MNGHAAQQWGLFPPLSTALPNEKQLIQNDAMVEELKRNNNFEAPEETEKRYAYEIPLTTLDNTDSRQEPQCSRRFRRSV